MLALEALHSEKFNKAVTLLRKALAQPEQGPTCPECKAAVLYECVACSSNNYPPKPQQDPVAWAVQGCSKMWRDEFAWLDAKAEAERIGGTCVAYALYTAPPQRQWVGLEAEDLAQIESDEFWQVGNHMAIAMAVEAKLKERNT
jgi:hypothetical protein